MAASFLNLSQLVKQVLYCVACEAKKHKEIYLSCVCLSGNHSFPGSVPFRFVIQLFEDRVPSKIQTLHKCSISPKGLSYVFDQKSYILIFEGPQILK